MPSRDARPGERPLLEWPTWTESTGREPQLITSTDDRGHAWAWLGTPLEGQPWLREACRWVAEYRLAIQDGRLIVAEVRVCPARWGLLGDAASGEDAGIAASDVPPGGLTTRLLRRLTIGAHVDFTRKLLEQLGGTVRWPDGRVSKYPPAWTIPGVADRPGAVVLIDLAAAGATKRAASAARRPNGKRAGRQPLSDAVLVEAAAAYRDARKRSPRPVPDAARALGMSEARMRDLVYRARKRGFLTPTKQGRGGGSFTPEADAILRRLRRKQHAPATRRPRRKR